MSNQIPSAQTVRERLLALEHGRMQELADKSGVPVTTLHNIRKSGKRGPTVDTVRKFWPVLLRMTAKKAAA
jgi:predicted transcriptional regulator